MDTAPTLRPRILIVEDVALMRELMGDILKSAGYVVSMASGVAQARLELVRNRPDLVLLDEILPGESSVDFLTELQASNVPAFSLTSMENPTHPVGNWSLGRLAKPGSDRSSDAETRLLTAIRLFLNR